tara:strand:+ start:220 stop:663 length:444 start_codon:yes stop_codon:yes gene_type:complete
MANKKNKQEYETVNITSKDIVILRFPSEWPVNEADLQAMMKTIRTAINSDTTIAKRFVCLSKGLEIETLKEEQFIQIWNSKFGDGSFEKATAENPDQLELFSDGAPDNIEQVMGNEMEVTLNQPDEDGNTWKELDDETYDKVQRGEL